MEIGKEKPTELPPPPPETAKVHYTVDGHGILVKMISDHMEEMLTILSPAVCTPAKGYLEDGGLQLLQSDTKRLVKQRDDLLEACQAYLRAMEQYGHPDKADRLMRRAIARATGEGE